MATINVTVYDSTDNNECRVELTGRRFVQQDLSWLADSEIAAAH